MSRPRLPHVPGTSAHLTPIPSVPQASSHPESLFYPIPIAFPSTSSPPKPPPTARSQAEHVRPPTHHESQGGEEEASNKFDVGAMAHDQPEAPKKGHRLSLLSLIGFWGPEGTVRKEQRPHPKPEAQAEGQSPAPLPGNPSPLCSRTPRVRMTAQMT